MRSDHAALFERIGEKLDQHGLTAREASMLATGKPDAIRDLKRAKGMPGADRLTSIADVLGTTVEWLIHGPGELADRADLARSRVRSEVIGGGPLGAADVRREFRPEDRLPALPLYGSAFGGEYGAMDDHVELTELYLSDVLEYLVRPDYLGADNQAYALKILGDSMAPRYEPGEKVAISPREPVAIGDDVIVQLREGDDHRIRLVLIKRLLRSNREFVELKQFNPERTFTVPRREIAHIHKVVSRLP